MPASTAKQAAGELAVSACALIVRVPSKLHSPITPQRTHPPTQPPSHPSRPTDRSSAGAAAASQFDDENEDEYGNDDDQFDEGGDAMDDGEDKAAGAAAGGGGSGRGSWSTSRRGGGRGGGLPTGALRHGAGGAGGTRRTLSAPDLQAFNVVASGQGSMRRTSPTGGWTANKVKRSYSTMDLEDLGQQFRPGATSDSDAAALLMKFMTKLGSEPSLSRNNSHVDLAAAAEAAVHATNEQAAAADIIASVGQRSFASAAAAEVKEEFAVGGTLKAGGLASSSSNELQSGVTDRSGSLGTETSRSSSNSRVGSIDDPTSMSVCGEGGVRGRNDSHESLSPVGLTMDDEMEGGQNPPPVAAVGVFGSSAGQGLGRRAAGSSVSQADKIVQVRPALGGPAPQGAPPTSS